MPKPAAAPWKRYRYARKDPDGLFLVRTKQSQVFLGHFYCDEFVVAGFHYNQTAGVKRRITHIAKVVLP